MSFISPNGQHGQSYGIPCKIHGKAKAHMSQGKRHWAHDEGYWGKASIQCSYAQDMGPTHGHLGHMLCPVHRSI